jgi:hypothetical protein
MPIPVPTSTVYRWATNLLNRSAPTDPEKVTGFRGGDPVPPLTVNDILGMLSDWVAYLGNAFANVQVIDHPAFSLAPWRAGTGAAVTLDATYVEVLNTGAGVNNALAISGPMPFGGQLQSVTADISSGVVGSDNELSFSITNAAGQFAVYEKSDIDVADSGTTVTLALQPSATLPESGGVVDVDGPYYLVVTAGAGSTLNDLIRFTGFTLNFA